MARAKIVRPDNKGPVTPGALSQGVSSYRITVNEDKTIILKPYSEIPAREKWIFENNSVLSEIKRGLEDSANGKVVSLGSFSQYLEKE